ncbi:MAG: HAD family hydrolase [Jatrophihabitans sp.]
MSKPGVLFDLDGTLVDTVYLHAVCWGEALRQHGHVVPMYAIAKAIGLGSDKLLPHLLGDEPEGADSISDAQAALYRAHQGRIAALPGARTLLARCDAAGKSVVLASSATADDLQMLRGVLDSDEHLAASTSSADADESKPHPGIVQVALDRAELRAADSIFVGDSIWDVQAAARADMPCVGIATGATSEAELAEAGAIATYPDLNALLGRLTDGALDRE